MRISILIVCTLVVVTSVMSGSEAFANLEYYFPNLGDIKIDKCVNDGGKNNCGDTANRIAAEAFCKAKNNSGVIKWEIIKLPAPTPSMRAYRTYTGSIRFQLILGNEYFKTIICKSNKVSRRYSPPRKLGQLVSVCVQGRGWQWIDPDRCSTQRQREIARKICREEGYVDQLSFLENAVSEGHRALLTYPKGTYYMTGGWGLGKGKESITDLTCWRY